jgi:hypothetical protein
MLGWGKLKFWGNIIYLLLKKIPILSILSGYL